MRDGLPEPDEIERDTLRFVLPEPAGFVPEHLVDALLFVTGEPGLYRGAPESVREHALLRAAPGVAALSDDELLTVLHAVGPFLSAGRSLPVRRYSYAQFLAAGLGGSVTMSTYRSDANQRLFVDTRLDLLHAARTDFRARPAPGAQRWAYRAGTDHFVLDPAGWPARTEFDSWAAQRSGPYWQLHPESWIVGLPHHPERTFYSADGVSWIAADAVLWGAPASAPSPAGPAAPGFLAVLKSTLRLLIHRANRLRRFRRPGIRASA